jgi:hypothetical protein
LMSNEGPLAYKALMSEAEAFLWTEGKPE